MDKRAWPFLVSRTKYLDYQPVVIPPFFKEQEAFLLAEAAWGEKTHPDYVLYREIRGFRAGQMSLLFRIVEADTSIIGQQRGAVLRDEVGRPIFLIEGFVLQSFMHDIAVTEYDFSMAHEQMRQAYYNFWHTSELFFHALFSRSVILGGYKRKATRLFQIERLPPFFIKPSEQTGPGFWKTLTRFIRRLFHF